MELLALLGFILVIAGEVSRFRDARLACVLVVVGVVLLGISLSDLEVKN